MIGKIISHYRILEKIGSGGMATVYKAEDVNLKRTVALKFLPLQFTVNEETKKRFITEARAASTLDHPNICTIYEIDTSNDGQMYIAMGYYDGETLNQKISTGQLDIHQVVNYAIQIGSGLLKAHEKGIIHRDTKPANIMITTDGIVKILDFGLAKLSGYTTLTRTGTVLGTTSYMSPEQVAGRKIDHRTDIWSMGVILYEMLTGHTPFQGDNEQAMMYAIMNKDPKPLQTYRKDIPDYIEKVIYKALIKKKDDRYQNIGDMVKDLKAKSAPDVDLPALENSIVVLPFKDFSEKRENEYFSDGLTEEIITYLSKIRNLLVISRGSAMTYKETEKKVKEIGKELNVRYALEGSVRKAGDDLRINAQLIDTKNDTHIWAEKYSGTLEDVFNIQEQVSRSIADALQVKLSPEEEKKLAKRPIKNIHAYDCYMRARQESWLFTPDAQERAIGYLKNGLEIIGENALLYAGMGYVYTQYVNMGMDIKANIAFAEEYAQKALQLDPDSSEANLVLGLLSQIQGSDAKKTIKYFKQALEINPGDVHAILWLCVSLANSGMMDDARLLVENAQQIDPLNPMSRSGYGIISLYEGKGDEAVEGIYEWFRYDKQNPAAVYFYALALVYAGRLLEAKKIIDQYIHSEWPDSFTKNSLLIKYAIEKDIGKIKQLVTGDYEKAINSDSQTAYFTVAPYILAGMWDKAQDQLEQAVRVDFINYPLISQKDPILEPIRKEERFKKLMKRVKDKWENFEV